ncbi:MAG: TerB family tellurite resistance protein [Maricaulaceae bacterium]
MQIVFGLVLGVAAAIWIGPANGLLTPLAADAVGETYANAAPAGLAIAGALYVVTGLITMVLSGISNLFARGASEKEQARQLDTFHDLLTGATVRMVGADGVIAASEMNMVSSVLEKFGQTPIAEKTIRSIAEASAKDPDKYLRLMEHKEHELNPEQKTHILRACLLVAMADVVLDPAELEYLNKVAEALKVPPEKLQQIRDELTNVTQRLVGAAAFAA